MYCPNCATEQPTELRLSRTLMMFVCAMCSFCWVGRACAARRLTGD